MKKFNKIDVENIRNLFHSENDKISEGILYEN